MSDGHITSTTLLVQMDWRTWPGVKSLLPDHVLNFHQVTRKKPDNHGTLTSLLALTPPPHLSHSPERTMLRLPYGPFPNKGRRRISYIICRAQYKMKMQGPLLKTKDKVLTKVIIYKFFSFLPRPHSYLSSCFYLLLNIFLSKEKPSIKLLAMPNTS